MKRFKSLVFVLACALFFVGAMGITKASAADELAATPQYETETIVVTGIANDTDVYYQVIKSNSGSGLKPANWIKAAKAAEGTYWIDFSATSNTKTAYFALTTDPESTSGQVVEVKAVIKSIKPILNYSVEDLKAKGLDAIFKGIEIKGIDSKYTTTKGKEATPDTYALIWKRGANGDWDVESKFEQVHWDMLKASNGTLYVSLVGDADVETYYDFRASKEAKVKIPKSAKAPTVKIDYAKGTIALKNGMQISQDETNWLTIPVYDKNATAEDKFVMSATTETKTKSKVSTVEVEALVTACNTNLSTQYAAETEVTLSVRTAATDKKFPSATATIKFKAPADAPKAAEKQDKNVSYTVADKTAKIAADMVIDVNNLIQKGDESDFSKFEYILLDGDVATTKVNLAKCKWNKIPADGKIDLSSKVGKTYKYTKDDGSAVTKKYEESTHILLRRVADKENELFASAYVAINLSLTKVEYKSITVTAPNATYEIEIKDSEAKKVKAGDVVTVTYKINEGYKLKGDVAVTGKDGDVESSTGKVTFTVKGDADVTVTISTAEDTPAEEPKEE